MCSSLALAVGCDMRPLRRLRECSVPWRSCWRCEAERSSSRCERTRRVIVACTRRHRHLRLSQHELRAKARRRYPRASCSCVRRPDNRERLSTAVRTRAWSSIWTTATSSARASCSARRTARSSTRVRSVLPVLLLVLRCYYDTHNWQLVRFLMSSRAHLETGICLQGPTGSRAAQQRKTIPVSIIETWCNGQYGNVLILSRCMCLSIGSAFVGRSCR